MSRNEPEEIQEARELLSEFEKVDDPSGKSEYFNNAFEIFNDFLEDNPESTYSTLVKNIKETYAKKLLKSFPEGSSLDLGDWLEYLVIIIKNYGDFSPILDSDENLKEKIKNHCSFWSEEIEKIIKK